MSEIYERNGVITFLGTNNMDDRVYFSADKLFLYEKKFNSKQALTGLLTIGTIHKLQNVKFSPVLSYEIFVGGAHFSKFLKRSLDKSKY